MIDMENIPRGALNLKGFGNGFSRTVATGRTQQQDARMESR